MRNEKYREFTTKEYLMGPNSLRLLDEMLNLIPGGINGGNVLDLGCGRAVTSLFVARETEADKVYAVDLWISATENYTRIREWKEESKIIPLHSDAADLPFADGFFKAIVSVDAYHYFGCADNFFAEKILPLMEPGGMALIAVPGLKTEFAGEIPDLLMEWAEDDVYNLHSCDWWRDHISRNLSGASVEVCESERFDAVWNDWLESGHEYAVRDKEYLEKGLKDILNFIIIVIKKD